MRPLRLVHLSLDRLAVRAEDIHLAAGDLGDIALFEIDEALRDREQRGYAACDEVLTNSEADDQRARDPAHDKSIGILCVDDEQRKRAGKACDRRLHRFDEIHSLLQVVVDKVRCNLGVGFRGKLVAFRLQLVLDLLVVLDDAVMDDRDAAAGKVRMCVLFCDATVCRPARRLCRPSCTGRSNRCSRARRHPPSHSRDTRAA